MNDKQIEILAKLVSALSDTTDVKKEHVEAAEDAKVEVKAKESAEEEQEAETQASEAEKKLAELEEAVKQQSIKEAKISAEKEAVNKGIDLETLNEISDFINYGMLVDDEGEVSQEALTKLIDGLSAVALRTPPKKTYTPRKTSDSGVGKYLDEK